MSFASQIIGHVRAIRRTAEYLEENYESSEEDDEEWIDLGSNVRNILSCSDFLK